MRTSAKSVNLKYINHKRITAKVSRVLSIDFVQGILIVLLDCAYKRGICAMCGKQVLDTTSYKQSSK